jgi:hypothetical protein
VQNVRSPFFIAVAKARRDRLLAERQMARALDEVLQEQVVGALLSLPEVDLAAVKLEPGRLPDVVVYGVLGGGFVQHGGSSGG